MATKLELEEQIRVSKCLQKEREVSDKRYAIKLVEIVVWGMVGLFMAGMLTAIMNLVLK